MRNPARLIATSLILWLAWQATADAAPPTRPGEAVAGTLLDASRWPMDVLRTKAGQTYRGLIQSEDEDEIEFVEIVRPPGKPMYLVIRPVRKKSIAEVRPLPRQERAVLFKRINALLTLKSRALIEAGRMEDVVLRETTLGGTPCLGYADNWFTLKSTADEETTRHSVVRVEQIFRAYRQLLPPRRKNRTNLRILLFGSMAEYRDYLRRHSLAIGNPAFYSVEGNMIVAGSNLTQFGERLAQTRAHHEKVRREYERRADELPRRLAQLAKDLKESGFSDDDISTEIKTRRLKWQNEFQAMLRRLDAAERRNEAAFNAVSRQMFTRLYHEAFHAYLENYVYPHGTYEVPRWLNEGLAQVFESGQLEADTLRIDAPRRRSLTELKDDLSVSRPMTLAELLTSQQGAFLVEHLGDGDASALHYDYAWGLAYYLTFYQPVLGTEALDAYVLKASSDAAPVARFERLVGAPLADFQRRWREAMLEMKPAPK